MAPPIVLVAVALVVAVQVFFLSRNSSNSIIIKPSFDPPPRLSHEDIESVLYVHKEGFPRKIWQTSKNGPAGLDDADREAVSTWTKLNQKWRYEAITQYSAESFVRESFKDRPEIIELFTDLQDPILRADMIRYLVLLKEGGLYSDIDTKSLKPIEDWIPAQFQTEASIVVGVEYDRLKGDRWADWTLDLQFTSWSILAKANHPLMELTVQKVMRNLKDLAIKEGTTMAELHPTFHQVLDATGPAAFTRAVFEHLSYELGESYTWKNVTDLKAPKLINDILILPITAFGCGQYHSNAHGPDHASALVQHLFKGSWKGDHGVDYENKQKEEDERKKKEQAEAENKKEEEEKEEGGAEISRTEEQEREKEDSDISTSDTVENEVGGELQ